MKITIRMDDITPDMDWGNFLRFRDLLDSHGIKPLIGVVPDNKDQKLAINEPSPTFWDVIRELHKDGWTIAMHGLNHLYTTDKGGLFPLNMKSEFAGYGYDEQLSMIEAGRRILDSHGLHTDIFMAPSHSYDKNTLKALRDNGFKKITDGFGTSPYRRNDITFYPISFRRADSLKSEKDGITTFVYHANTMTDKEFKDLDKLLETGRVVSYSAFEDYNEIKERRLFANIREYILATTKRILVKL
ncbi:MAG: DUF2334 domain-containing protein [Butyrivibrio sp.]|nr:DUF2334 domain-containing protein [Butyrivibrio sp.]